MTPMIQEILDDLKKVEQAGQEGLPFALAAPRPAAASLADRLTQESP